MHWKTLSSIVGRELRSRARKPSTYQARLISALCCLVAGAMVLLRGRTWGATGLGPIAFSVLSMLALVFALVEGVRLTADSISGERREGTLGLLFLADVNALDVVLGKLAAGWFSAVCGVLALAPILAVPIMMGGVTQGEAARMAVVLLSGLFLALCLGMLASACAREEGRAFGVAVGLAGLAFLGLPLMDISLVSEDEWMAKGILSLASPLRGWFLAFDLRYQLRPGLYWGSIAGIWVTGLLAVLAGAVRASRGWGMEAEQAKALDQRSKRKVNRRLLDAHPFAWLLVRLTPDSTFWLVVLVATVGSALFTRRANPQMSAAQMMYQGVNVLCWVALHMLAGWRACSCLADLLKSGRMELVSTTPLGRNELATGLVKAWWRLMAGVVAAGALLQCPDMVASLDHMRQTTLIAVTDWGIYQVLAFIQFLLNLAAISIVSVWLTFRGRRPVEAAFLAWGVVVLAPVLLTLLSSDWPAEFVRMLPASAQMVGRAVAGMLPAGLLTVLGWRMIRCDFGRIGLISTRP